MAAIRAIRTKEDYDMALSRISCLMDVLSGPDGQEDDETHPARIEFEALADLIEQYEDIHYPFPPTPTSGDASGIQNGMMNSTHPGERVRNRISST